jgi:predicted metal-binding membrane protein
MANASEPPLRSTGAVGSLWSEAPALALLGLAAAAAWAWVIWSGGGSSAPGAAMGGMAAMGPMSARPSLSAAAAPAAAMTLAMMLPVAAPVLIRRRSGSLRFAAGYLTPWLAFGLALTCLTLASPLASVASDKRVAAAALAGAGLFQLSPVKRRALRACAGLAAAPAAGAPLAAGAHHGMRCVASGAPLMAAAMLTGAMSPAWIAGLAGLMLAEKTRAGLTAARLVGLGLIAAAGLQLAG